MQHESGLGSFTTARGDKYSISNWHLVARSAQQSAYRLSIFKAPNSQDPVYVVNIALSDSLISIWKVNARPNFEELLAKVCILKLAVLLEKQQLTPGESEIKITTYDAAKTVENEIQRLETEHEEIRRQIQGFTERVEQSWRENESLSTEIAKSHAENQVQLTSELRSVYVHLATIAAAIAAGALVLGKGLLLVPYAVILLSLVMVVSMWRLAALLENTIIKINEEHNNFQNEINELKTVETEFLVAPSYKGIDVLQTKRKEMTDRVRRRQTQQKIVKDGWLSGILWVFSFAIVLLCFNLLPAPLPQDPPIQTTQVLENNRGTKHAQTALIEPRQEQKPIAVIPTTAKEKKA